MKAKTIQICGTGSGVGKSVVVSALCRILLEDGYRVCPFKAQNMALNSYVTKEGGEIGRAQATQAQAARLEPTVDMNPILIKPTSDRRAQIIVTGKPVKNMSVYEYVKYKKKAKGIILNSFKRLAADYEAVVIEGAGSPAEINLKAHDIVNMQMAKHARAPVILVGDIDKGGVFAWLVGTMELLTKEERKMVKGFIINKFRGDKRLLRPGIDFLEKKTGKKVLGVIPYFKDIKIPEEDSVPLEKRAAAARKQRASRRKVIDIAIISLPHISNFTDFDALENEPDVRLRYVSALDEPGHPDVIIIPGSKSTIFDLNYLRKSGLAQKIRQAFEHNPRLELIGLCGGYQMLGECIYDRGRTEAGQKETKALGFLPVVTAFEKGKILCRVKAKEISSGSYVRGYEIHHGRTRLLGGCKPIFKIIERQGKKAADTDGASLENSRVWGAYLHGVFDEHNFRRSFLNRLRRKKGWAPLTITAAFNLDKEFDKLAQLFRENMDMALLYKIMKDGA
ncbi:MAG: cobyric acid synthase [Candidatus Omnitrophica bacterium]|nr:cobyric acid synthase [Candidatus Omnitrophota bacterium]